MHIIFKQSMKLIPKIIKKCKIDHISAFAAQSAFFIILSVIPFLMVFVSLIQYTPITKNMLLDLIQTFIPDYISPLLSSVLQEVYNNSGTLISITAIAAMWASAKGIQYLTEGLNQVFGCQESRNFFYLRIRAILDTLIFLLVLVAALVFLVFGNSIRKLLVQHFPVPAMIVTQVLSMRSVIVFLFLMIFFLCLYKFLPNRKTTFKMQLPGTILCVISWYLVSVSLSVYIDKFNGFSMYGSLTTIVLLMLWMYFCMYIVLICAEINQLYEKFLADFKDAC